MNRAALFGVAICFLLGWSQLAAAQEAEAPEEAPPQTTVRVYEISDLLIIPNPYPYRSALSPVTRLSQAPGAAGVSSGGGGLFMSDSSGGDGDEFPTRRDIAASLTELIRTTVDPDNWREAGGTIGSMTEFNGRLVVTQTPETHDQIAALLADLRKDQHPQVGLSARWVRLSADQAHGLLQKEKGGVVSPEKLAELLKANPQAMVYEGRTRCFNTQTVNIASGRGQTVVVASTPVVATGTKGVAPQVEQVFIGALLEITPTLYTGGSAVVVDLHSIVSEDFTSSNPKVHEDDFLDRMGFAVQHLDTTTRIPVGVPVLLGGMTTSRQDTRDPLYLILEVTTE